MNKARRANLQKAIDLLKTYEHDKVNAAKELIADAMGEEEEYLDNMPEAMAEGEKGDDVRNAIDNMENAISMIENLDWEEDDDDGRVSILDDVMTAVDEAMAS